MKSAQFSKKQISLPSFVTRLTPTMLDLLIVISVFFPITNYLSFYIFKWIFSEFLLFNNIAINNLEDINRLFFNEDFQVYAATTLNLIAYFIAMPLVMFFLYSFYFIFFWHKFGTTPMKYFFSSMVLDHDTFKYLSIKSCILRYLGYLFFPFSVFTIIFRKDKKAIHDLISNSIVIKS